MIDPRRDVENLRSVAPVLLEAAKAFQMEFDREPTVVELTGMLHAVVATRRANTYGGILLLALRDYEETTVVIDALVYYACHQELEGDFLGAASVADRIADRARELRALASIEVDQHLRDMGIGRYQQRPQG